MKDGFVKVAAASIPVRVADCAHNASEAAKAVDAAFARGVQVLCLQELGLTGYTCADLFFQQTLLRGARDGLRALQDATRGKPMLVFVGLPLAVDGKLYNCAAALFDGRLLGVVPKQHLPNCAEADEARRFAPGPAHAAEITVDGARVPFGPRLLFRCENLPELVVGCELCEDVWAPQPPSSALALLGATVICNLSASVALAGKAQYRRELIATQSARLDCGYVYCSAGAGESTTDLVFSGHHLLAEDGRVLAEHTQMRPGMILTEFDVARLRAERRRRNTFFPLQADATDIFFTLPTAQTVLTRTVDPSPFFPADLPDPAGRCTEILDIQAAGLAQRLTHTGVKTCVLGLSGGLDSTLALLVCVRACDLLGRDRKDILTVTMPCFGTTSRTRDNAGALAKLLGTTFRTIPIADAVTQHFCDIGLPADDRSAAFENAQARERTQVLMDLANRCCGLVVGTGDLSELALGWATYNGDHMSMYAVNASVPKTLVRKLVAHCADAAVADLAAVLRDILDTPVSPELLPPTDGEIAQKTEDLVGPYALHDFFLYYMVRCGFSPTKIYRLALRAFAGAYADAVILQWLRTFCRRFFAQQFKRSCAPDGPATGAVCFSPRAGLRMPSDACWTLWQTELDTL